MKGYQLTSGTLSKQLLSERDIWQYLDIIFSSKSKNQSSYKYGLVRAITESCYRYDQRGALKLDELFQPFSQLYWNLVIRYNLKQTDKSHKLSIVEKVLVKIRDKHRLPNNIHFDRLNKEVQKEVYFEVFKACKRYVVGALYADTNNLFYEFDLSKNHIRLNPALLTFIKKFQAVLLRLNNYEFAKFIDKNNARSRTAHLLFILENITKRKNLLQYKTVLLELEKKCFYCPKEFKANSKIEVDHFIPWSYMRKDDLWNLVVACRDCNNSKRDKIPELALFKKLIERNNSIDRIKNSGYSERILKEIYNYLKLN